jgi:YD repeat-containing protein
MVLVCVLTAAFAQGRASADSQRVGYEYDEAGRVIRVRYAEDRAAHYVYDGAGNIVVVTVENGAAGEPPTAVQGAAPADGASDVDPVGVRLTWLAAAAPGSTYDVYLGRENPPPLWRRSLAAPELVLAVLAAREQYFWQVVTRSPDNRTAAGPIHRFSTGNTPPAAPVALAPRSEGAVRYKQLAVEWAPAVDPNGDPIVYDVYLGGSRDALQAIATDVAASFYLLGQDNQLDPDHSYYWQVVARDRHGGSAASEVQEIRALDSDGDGVPDEVEELYCNDPSNPDTDGDGLNDGEERALGSHPCKADSDGDGLPDGLEVRLGLSPTDPADAATDIDGDGWSTIDEFRIRTDPNDPQSKPVSALEDFEGVPTQFYWFSEGDARWRVRRDTAYRGAYAAHSGAIGDDQSTSWETYVHSQGGEMSFYIRPATQDRRDFVTLYIDDVEAGQWSGGGHYRFVAVPLPAGRRHIRWVYQRDGSGGGSGDAVYLDDIYLPAVPDSDGDGIVDGWEIRYFDRLDADLSGDSDGDGLDDAQEGALRTDPTAADTDGDAMPDLWEIEHGFDPNIDDGLQDADGDGRTNAGEHSDGTDPNDPASVSTTSLETFEDGTAGFYWYSIGDPVWSARAVQNRAVHGARAAGAVLTRPGQSTTWETHIMSPGGTMVVNIFHNLWRDETLELLIDGQRRLYWWGRQNYTTYSIAIDPGPHHIKWLYSRPATSRNNGKSEVWLDNIYLPALPDSDGDGIVDGWELRFFGGLDHDLSGDSDGDGASDAQEGAARSDPSSPDSAPAVADAADAADAA